MSTSIEMEEKKNLHIKIESEIEVNRQHHALFLKKNLDVPIWLPGVKTAGVELLRLP